jgi:hypothetical protein
MIVSSARSASPSVRDSPEAALRRASRSMFSRTPGSSLAGHARRG